MAADFLNRIDLTDAERTKLAGLGAASPLALLDMRRASQDAFDNWFPGRSQAIAGELEKLLSDDERESLKSPPKSAGKLGGRLGKPIRTTPGR